MLRNRSTKGFTIVELLIVIVVIGVLAVIAVTGFQRAQTDALNKRIRADLSQLSKAIQAARTARGDVALIIISGSGYTANGCNRPAGTNLATLDKATDSCWIAYNQFLDRVSTAAGTNVRDLVDPWGRPYFIDENEGENIPVNGPCNARDRLGVYTQPSSGSATQSGLSIYVPFVTPGCS